MYLSIFRRLRGGRVYPEFPTGNGKACPDAGRINLIINYAGQKYGLEVKSYTDDTGYKKAIKQKAPKNLTLGAILPGGVCSFCIDDEMCYNLVLIRKHEE
jgi:hypothetical protein